jgi:hypothetical protein
MSWINIVSGTFIILYGLGSYFWNRKVGWRLNEKTSKWLRYSHYFLTTLTILAGLLIIIDDISFRGKWTTRIILIGFLLTGCIIYPLTNWADKSKIEKNYFRLLSFLPTLTAGFAMIPFLGGVLLLSLFGRLTEPVKDIYYEDSKLRVQSTFIGVLGPPRLEIFQKQGLFEIRLNKSHRSAADIDSVRVDKNRDATLVIVYNERFEQKGEFDADTIKVKRVE